VVIVWITTIMECEISERSVSRIETRGRFCFMDLPTEIRVQVSYDIPCEYSLLEIFVAFTIPVWR
jgi:hypothetical protein